MEKKIKSTLFNDCVSLRLRIQKIRKLNRCALGFHNFKSNLVIVLELRTRGLQLPFTKRKVLDVKIGVEHFGNSGHNENHGVEVMGKVEGVWHVENPLGMQMKINVLR